jgi:hypothetical protein
MGLEVTKCVFIDGVHYGYPGCYHEQTEDELGAVQETGWTVQQSG